MVTACAPAAGRCRPDDRAPRSLGQLALLDAVQDQKGLGQSIGGEEDLTNLSVCAKSESAPWRVRLDHASAAQGLDRPRNEALSQLQGPDELRLRLLLVSERTNDQTADRVGEHL